MSAEELRNYFELEKFEIVVEGVTYEIEPLLGDTMKYSALINNIRVVFKASDNGDIEPDVPLLIYKDIDKSLLYAIAEKIENYFL